MKICHIKTCGIWVKQYLKKKRYITLNSHIIKEWLVNDLGFHVKKQKRIANSKKKEGYPKHHVGELEN